MDQIINGVILKKNKEIKDEHDDTLSRFLE